MLEKSTLSPPAPRGGLGGDSGLCGVLSLGAKIPMLLN